jgi:hypothetical protein
MAFAGFFFGHFAQMQHNSGANRLPVRARGLRLTYDLAAEQGEEARLRDAMRLIRNWEKKTQRKDTDSTLQSLGMSPNKKRKRGRKPEHLMDMPVLKLRKRSEGARKHIIPAVLCKLQGALSRYHLRKRARGVFSMRASRREFLALLGGRAEVKEHSSGRLYCTVTGATKGEILQKLAAIFGTDSNWFARRYYGGDHKVERDCAYLKFDPSHDKRSSFLFSWRLHKVAQVDRKGRRIVTTIGKLSCKLPRGVSTVKPLKKFRKSAGQRGSSKASLTIGSTSATPKRAPQASSATAQSPTKRGGSGGAPATQLRA